MSLHRITDVDELHRYLYAAMQLEHATIPAYLTALYSIHPGTNTHAYNAIRAVVVEEMLHLTLAANLLNAVGGTPDFTRADFVPNFPTYLPDGETDFQVSRQGFSKAAIETFLKIERPARPRENGVQTVQRTRRSDGLHAVTVGKDSEEHFYSIGEFYKAIQEGIELLYKQMGDGLFSGDPARQVTPDYYYSGGGELIAVTDLDSAKAAIRLISEQGEGIGGAIFDYEGEIAHYYRFEQLLLGRYYQKGDEPGSPSGSELEVDWQAAFPIKTDARLADYPEGSALRTNAAAFNTHYAEFLALLTEAVQGQPDFLVDCVGWMFRFKEMSYQLMRQPIDGANGLCAAPTFEIAATHEA